MTPEHLRYSEDHEWAWETETGHVRFGITDFAQHALGDVVYVMLPEVGAELTAGQPCGEVESTKSVSDLFAPVTGVVVGVNGAVETAPETVNADPYGSGWLVEVEPTGADPLAGLLTSAEYEALVERQG